jgi:hypothetical protein
LEAGPQGVAFQNLQTEGVSRADLLGGLGWRIVGKICFRSFLRIPGARVANEAIYLKKTHRDRRFSLSHFLPAGRPPFEELFQRHGPGKAIHEGA